MNPPETGAPPPLDLPRLVMRRAAVVAVAVLLLAVLAGLQRMRVDIDDEVDAAVALAELMARLSTLGVLDDTSAVASLQTLQAATPMRHLTLEVTDASGQTRLAPPREPAPAWPLRMLLAAHREWLAGPDRRVVSWPLPRPDGSRWTVSLHASRESERSEAMVTLLGTLALLLLCVAGLLVAMHLNVRRGFAPLQALLQAIAGIERGQTAAVRALPPMPVRELDQVAQALRHLAQALDDAESQRQALAQRVITLQEDERASLARELHDEFGQQLTALRVDAAWLTRRLHADDAALAVVQSVTGHARHIQQELRGVLARLRPLQGLGDDGVPASALADLLRTLVHGWDAAPPPAPRVQLHLQGFDGDAAPLPSPLALAVYRITQEALTNAARHAQARDVHVSLVLGEGTLEWQVCDDGVGIGEARAALLRGSGLVGLRERVLALGAELQMGPNDTPGPDRKGLRLAARLTLGADRTARATLPVG